jgi:hypothetical protein
MTLAPNSARLKQFCPLLLAAVVSWTAGCSKLGGGSATENSPVGPSSNFNVTGTWTGTLSRPDGSTVAVRWQAATGSGEGALSGPVTLTYNGVSVTVPGLASVAGNDRSGYTFLLGMMGKPGDTPALPNCYVIGTTPAESFRSPYNSISTSPFDITYNNCSGFIAPPPQRLQVGESTRLTLNK